MTDSDTAVNTVANTMFLPLTLVDEPIRSMSLPASITLEGWVYVLTNPHMPGIYKIGMTTNEPEVRAHQISQGTGIPAPFEVKSAYFSDSPKTHESELHEYLQDFRISPNREFFKCSEEDLEEAFCAAGLASRASSVEEIANSHNVICFEKDEPYSLSELFDDLDLQVFGCQYAALKRLVEIAKFGLEALGRKGCSIIFHDGKATPIVSEMRQNREAYEQAINDAGAYGPKRPWKWST